MEPWEADIALTEVTITAPNGKVVQDDGNGCNFLGGTNHLTAKMIELKVQVVGDVGGANSRAESYALLPRKNEGVSCEHVSKLREMSIYVELDAFLNGPLLRTYSTPDITDRLCKMANSATVFSFPWGII